MENTIISDVVIKLCSGEEIFASIVNVNGDMITFESPMKISRHYSETPNGMSIQLNFEPFMDYSSTIHTYNRQHVMSCEPLIPRLSTLYSEMKESVRNGVAIKKSSESILSATIH